MGIVKNIGFAHSPSPGYPATTGISKVELDDWIEGVDKARIVSIICLLHPDEHLRYYKHLPGGGLLEYYKKFDFTVAHILYKDHLEPLLSGECLEKIYQAYLELHKPALIHCSAGEGRTMVAIKYILNKTEKKKNSTLSLSNVFH